MNEMVTSGRARTIQRRMEATRADILDHARAIIIAGGVDALTARALAQAASVSLSTLYSLVGKREAIFAALLGQMQQRTQERMAALDPLPGLETVEALSTEVAALCESDETRYRAACLTMAYLDYGRSRVSPAAERFDWGKEMIRTGIVQCARQGLLRGLAPIDTLGELATLSYRDAYRRWSYGEISIAEARYITLSQSYFVLMADAVDAFRIVLDGRLARLTAPGA